MFANCFFKLNINQPTMIIVIHDKIVNTHSDLVYSF